MPKKEIDFWQVRTRAWTTCYCLDQWFSISYVFENGIFFVEVNIAMIIMYNNENRIKHLQINRTFLAAFIF